ncbi:MAG: NADH-quinone oxidoreductase subunit NuoE [Marinilabiliales bacterium]|nr:MAG: NADH-quinone oxidoreductase subunit NuoE [Marinilabiliales bacterium]
MRAERIKIKRQDLVTDGKCDTTLLDEVIRKYSGKKGIMIPVLQETQKIFGYIPREAFLRLSDELALNLSDMYGVVTFYAQFRLSPVGRHIIRVCHGTACHVQSAGEITGALEEALNVKDGGTTKDGLFTLESVACLGCCSLAPVMMIGEDTYGKLTGKDAVRVIKNIRIDEKELPV